MGGLSYTVDPVGRYDDRDQLVVTGSMIEGSKYCFFQLVVARVSLTWTFTGSDLKVFVPSAALVSETELWRWSLV